MKKLLLCCALSACGTMTARAQGARFGLKAGGSLTTYVGKSVSESTSSKLGFHGGVVANLGLTDRLAIQPELLYSMKGIRDESTTRAIKIDQTLYYIDVPVLVKLCFSQLFLEAGPQVGVLVAAKGTVESGQASLSQSNKREFNDVDLGYALGVGFQTTSGFMMGLRYNGGLRNVLKPVNTNNGSTRQPEGRNSALQLYIGFLMAAK